MAAQEYILSGAQLRDEGKLLMDEADPQIHGIAGAAQPDGEAFPQHLAAIGGHHTADDVHERRFARTIFTGERVDLPGTDVQIDMIEHSYAAE